MRPIVKRTGLFVVVGALAAGCTGTFERLDTDANGVLTKAEAGRSVPDFDDYDFNQDGKLSAAEYAELRRALQARQRQAQSGPSRRSGGFGGGGGGGFGS